MMSKPGIGIVGYGYWGPNILRNFIELQKICNLAGCSDLDESKLSDIKTKYPNISITKDFNDLLKDPKINALVIATPAKTHFDIAKKCLEAGKSVLIEKPFVTNSEEAKELTDLSKKKKLVLMVGHTFLYNPVVRMLKKYIDEKVLGDIYYIHSVRVNLGQVRRDVNALWNFAPHDVSILIYLLNELPHSVSVKGKRFLQKDIEDLVFMNLDFNNNITAHFHLSWLDPSKTRKMTIVGSNKMAIYDDVDNEAKLKVYDKGVKKNEVAEKDYGAYQLKIHSGDILIPKLDNTEPLKEECKHFIDCIVNNKTPLTDGEHGIKVVKILEASQESLENDGQTIRINW